MADVSGCEDVGGVEEGVGVGVGVGSFEVSLWDVTGGLDDVTGGVDVV